jgi:hypothetical protein
LSPVSGTGSRAPPMAGVGLDIARKEEEGGTWIVTGVWGGGILRSALGGFWAILGSL